MPQRVSPRHRLLSRQLLRQLGIASPEQEAELFRQLAALGAREGGAVGKLLAGLPAFVEQVNQSYALYDRDTALASRSIEISSDELLTANARMRDDFEAQQRALVHLRQAFRQMAVRAGLAEVEDNDQGLEALSERLNALVASRVQAEAALRQAKQEADAANAAKSRFLANVSHEIRTPLNGLLGMAELMLDEPLSPRQLERLRMVRESGASLLAIINDILDVSKIEAGKLEIEQIEFDPHAVFEQLIAIHGEQARAKALVLEVDLELPPRTRLVGDPLRLSQVLGNLLSNAVKFTPRGSVKLQCRLVDADRVAPATVLLKVVVQDSGVGIAPEIAATLFQPFTQADAATTRRHGGTGLGLAIARHLAELMGGRVGLDSSAGPGSRFWAEFPFVRSTSDFASTEIAEFQLARWVGRRVLLVEDNAVNVIVAQQQLEHFGLSVRVAEHGAVALDAMASEPFDLVLMDCQMPVMDGYEAVRRWRTLERACATPSRDRMPILALTANSMTGDRERSLDAGFDDHLGKPFSRADLRAMLSRWMPCDEDDGPVRA